jgi:HK97 family phage prohead protease
MTMHFKNAAFELKREPDEDGVFEGYASVFDVVDLGMDVVAKGAFAKSLAVRKPKMLWQHSMADPIGVWDEIREDERGLYVKGRLLKDVQKGREAIALIKALAIDGMSIGYRTIEAIDEAGGRVRKLIELELHEISIVTNPMLPVARVASIKSEDGRFDIRSLERALRDVCGFSQSEAKALLADGFKGLQAERDVAASGKDADADATAFIAKLMQSTEICNVRT